MLSDRLKNASESITLKLNAKAEELRNQGKHVYNLTAGQLPFFPDKKLIENISSSIEHLGSYQYSPVPGLPSLRKKVMEYIEQTREIVLRKDTECVVSTGAKQSLFNLLATLINPGDEVVVLAPYWLSYSEMIRYWEGTMVVVPHSKTPGCPPEVSKIIQALSPKTKAIILNTPCNPLGIYYDDSWIEDFATCLSSHPQVQIISDEIYSQLSYFGPGPKYPYHFRPDLLARTYIIDGASKSMACTGLRIGFTCGPREVMKAMGKIQGQSTSGANSLIQKALVDYDFSGIQSYLEPIKKHLQDNSMILEKKLTEYGLEQLWYQVNGAFYFFLSLENTPVFKRWQKLAPGKEDWTPMICEEMIAQTGVVVVPGGDFGQPNGVRLSLVAKSEVLKEALDRIFRYLTTE